ncbi:polymer-forming cytoskeletal protein [Halocella sp. SP3-1]|uniref:bactofilin family protein n=1 Tax=Halocella sp. SP3-1 TaxID=2382161 RepID=UPI000F757573|nr:polymer-forming cytoskeletal protein [Halocella sp. SP3-1]AZO93586.1 polymer-forming cytoskeletal protein [Halocella sp. SP3-1]
MLGSKDKKIEEAKGKVETILGTGTIIEGDIHTKGSLRIEGEVKGNIKADGDVFVGENGKLITEVKARKVVVAGKIEGNINASQKVEILPSGKIIGDLQTKTLKIEEGALFQGASKPLDEGFKKSADPVNKAKKEAAAVKK